MLYVLPEPGRRSRAVETAHDRALGFIQPRIVLCDGSRDSHIDSSPSPAFFGFDASRALGDQMARSIILWGVEESSMGGGSWNDEIICTLRKDGSLSLRPRKLGDDGATSIAGVNRIRAPKIFVQALISLADSCFNYDINPKEIVDEICPRLDQLDPEFSREIRAYISSSNVKI
jgi:hypothetical protein